MPAKTRNNEPYGTVLVKVFRLQVPNNDLTRVDLYFSAKSWLIRFFPFFSWTEKNSFSSSSPSHLVPTLQPSNLAAAEAICKTMNVDFAASISKFVQAKKNFMPWCWCHQFLLSSEFKQHGWETTWELLVLLSWVRIKIPDHCNSINSEEVQWPNH